MNHEGLARRDLACYLINLDRSPQRLAQMLPRLAKAGIACERIAGVDGMTLGEAEFAAQTRENLYYKPLRRGEVGCHLSHLKSLGAFLASGARYALVLEDDAVFEPQLASVLAAALALRDRTADRNLRWDVLKLNHRRRRHVDLAALGSQHRLVQYGPSVPIATTATVWTRAGARRWVDAYRGARRPIDCDLQHPWEYGLTILSVHPPVAVPGDVPSAMGAARAKVRSPWPKMRYELRRLWPKLSDFGRRYGWGFMSGWLWRPRLEYRTGTD